LLLATKLKIIFQRLKKRRKKMTGKKDDAFLKDFLNFVEADMALGMMTQSGPDDRDEFVDYAKGKDYLWALRRFLSRRGWIDEDWEKRLTELGL
jgi:hypothetical protein